MLPDFASTPGGRLLLKVSAILVLLSVGTGMDLVAQEPVTRAKQPEKELPEGWYARIETSKGTILARLMPEQAPQAVAHFVGLAEGTLAWTDPFTGEMRNDPYYDGLEIHRVYPRQRFEVGDHTGTGSGAAPFYLPPEGFRPVAFGYGWRLGMTTAPLGRISGSLFFVTESPMPWLNDQHPCFGVVWSGRDVVRSISMVKTNKSGKPRQPITIQRIRIFKQGEPAPIPAPEPYTPEYIPIDRRDDTKAEGDN